MNTVRFAEEKIIVEIASRNEPIASRNEPIAHDTSITHDLSLKEKKMLWWMPLTPTASDSKKRKLDEILSELDKFTAKISCAEGFVQTPIGDETKGDLPSIDGWDPEDDIDGYDSDEEYPPLLYGKDYTPSPVTGEEVEDPRDIPEEWLNNFKGDDKVFEDIVKEFESYLESEYNL